ncbi:MAG: hypothetical protein KDE22_01775 [Rhodobacterales bacterium]|nr:hypothetical protein [Rhodobacterales bacterium]
MSTTLLISIIGSDRVGLVAAAAGTLFDLGGNLSDTSFTLLGGGAEFTTVCDMLDDVAPEAVRGALAALPELEGADIVVTAFALPKERAPTGATTHVIQVAGGDRPGLIARLCEVLGEFEANIVKLDAVRLTEGGTDRYEVNMSVWLPAARADSCLAAIQNTAGGLGLTCQWRVA